MAPIDTTSLYSPNPDDSAQRILRLAAAAANQPWPHQQRQAMLGVLRERLLTLKNGEPLPRVYTVLATFPGGEDGYWAAWLDHEQVPREAPAAQLVALHTVSELFDDAVESNLTPACRVDLATAPQEVQRVQAELRPLLADHLDTPEVLRSRLLWLAGHPRFAYLICRGLRTWLTVRAAEPSPAEAPATAEAPPKALPPAKPPSPRNRLQLQRNGYARDVFRKEGLAPDPEPEDGELWTLDPEKVAALGGLWQLAGKHAAKLPTGPGRTAELDTKHAALNKAFRRVIRK